MSADYCTDYTQYLCESSTHTAPWSLVINMTALAAAISARYNAECGQVLP